MTNLKAMEGTGKENCKNNSIVNKNVNICPPNNNNSKFSPFFILKYLAT